MCWLRAAGRRRGLVTTGSNQCSYRTRHTLLGHVLNLQRVRVCSLAAAGQGGGVCCRAGVSWRRRLEGRLVQGCGALLLLLQLLHVLLLQSLLQLRLLGGRQLLLLKQLLLLHEGLLLL